MSTDAPRPSRPGPPFAPLLVAALLVGGGVWLALRARSAPEPASPPAEATGTANADAGESAVLPSYGQLPRVSAEALHGGRFDLRSLRGKAFLLHYFDSSQPGTLDGAIGLLGVVRTLEMRKELSLERLALVAVDLSRRPREEREAALKKAGLETAKAAGERAWHVLGGKDVWPLVERTAEIMKPPRSAGLRFEHPSDAMVHQGLFLLVDPSAWVRAAHTVHFFDYVEGSKLVSQVAILEQVGAVPESADTVVARPTAVRNRCEWPVPKG